MQQVKGLDGWKFFVQIFLLIAVILGAGGDHEISHARGEEFEVRLERAHREFYAGNYQEAEGMYRELIESRSNDPAPYWNLSVIYREQGRYQQAIELYEALLEKTAAEPVEVLGRMGWLYYLSGDYAEAEEILRGLLVAYDPRDAELYFRLGLVCLRLEEIEEAEMLFSQALAVEPRFAPALFELGRLAYRRERLDEAAEYLIRTLGSEPGFREVHGLLGRIFFEKGDLVQAYQRLTAASRILGQDPDLAFLLDEIVERRPDLVAKQEEEKEIEREKVTLIGVEPLPVQKQEKLRVRLVRQAQKLRFMAGSTFSVVDENGQKQAEGLARQEWRAVFDGQTVTLYPYSEKDSGNKASGSKLRIVLEDPRAVFMIYDMDYGAGYFWAGREDRRFRGDLIFRAQDEGMQLVNEVGLEEYLASVVPSEMPAGWPMDALRAQAVAARSYTLRRLRRNPGADYHLRGSVIDAAYNGVDGEHARTTQAVVETEGEILVYNGEIIDAVYSANSGGLVESSRDIWGSEVPYLQFRPERDGDGEATQKFPLSPRDLEEWIRKEQESFSAPQNYGSSQAYSWFRMIPRTELEELVHRRKEIGTITGIAVISRGQGGSVQEVRIRGENGEYVVRGDSIRGVLGAIRSNRFFVETEYNPEGIPRRFYFYGSGWGHGVGMSQTGAANVASDGWNYQDILEFYYPGTKLVDFRDR